MSKVAMRLFTLSLIVGLACGTTESTPDQDALTVEDSYSDDITDVAESDLGDGAGDYSIDTTEPDVLPDANTFDSASQDATNDTDESPIPGCAEPAEPLDWGDIDPLYTPVSTQNAFGDKNLYLLTLFEAVAQTGALFDSGDLAALGADRLTGFEVMADACSAESCDISGVLWSQADIDDAGTMLVAALGQDGDAKATLIDHVRSSGKFGLFTDLDDDALVTAAWEQAITAMNNDASRFASDAGVSATNDVVQALRNLFENDSLIRAYQPLMQLVLALVEASGRDEAARYEPLTTGENAAAIAAIPDIDWDAYPYTVILVPGWGPDDLETPLSDVGAQHCDLAVERWLAGWAPFIALSGGHVHPDRTPYAEAIQMKQYLMETHGVPEDAIIIDPHARHTTTNLRNVGRLVITYGIPPERPLVTTTDFMQSIYITALGNRCMEELGYLPWREISALTLEDNCMYVSPDVLRVAPEDPLDP